MSDSKLTKRIKDIVNQDIYSEFPPFPKKGMLIEVTNYCNDSCLFCYNNFMTRKREYIDSSLVKKVLVEAYQLGMREVGFYTTGEPLLNKKLDDYVLQAKGLGYKYIYLTTNGSLADIDRIESLVNNGLNSIKFSINAINRNDYFLIHGRDDFDKVLKNLEDAYNYKINNDIDLNVFVSYIETKYTNYLESDIKNFFDKKCDEVVVMSVENQGGLMPEINELLLDSKRIELDTTKKLPCSYPFKSVIVTKEGYLTACCLDFQNYLAYADLNKISLKEAWHNKIITEFRKKQLNQDVGATICSNCVFNKNITPKPLNQDLASYFEYDDGRYKECLVKRISKIEKR